MFKIEHTLVRAIKECSTTLNFYSCLIILSQKECWSRINFQYLSANEKIHRQAVPQNINSAYKIHPARILLGEVVEKAKGWNKPNIVLQDTKKCKISLPFKKITAFSIRTLQKELKDLINME